MNLENVSLNDFIRKRREIKVGKNILLIEPVSLLSLLLVVNDFLPFYLYAKDVEKHLEQKVVFNAKVSKQFLLIFVKNLTAELLDALTDEQVQEIYDVVVEVNDFSILEEAFDASMIKEQKIEEEEKPKITLLDLIFDFMMSVGGIYKFRDILEMPAAEWWALFKLLMRYNNRIQGKAINYVKPPENELKELKHALQSIGVMVN